MISTDNSLTFPRWNEVLVAIYNNNGKTSYCQRINRRVKGSLTHLRNIVKLLEKKSLIEIQSMKKIKRLVLTEKGKRVTVALQQVKEELNQCDN